LLTSTPPPGTLWMPLSRPPSVQPSATRQLKRLGPTDVQAMNFGGPPSVKNTLPVTLSRPCSA
jgi:hypothetical protein